MQLPRGLLDAVIWQESKGDPNAVSPAGAMGLMQVMPDTAKDPGFGVKPLADPFNAEDNKRFGTQYLSAMLGRYKGDIPRALAAYNWGPGNADKWDGNMASLPAETQGYIQSITSRLPSATETPVQTQSPERAPDMPGPMNIAPAAYFGAPAVDPREQRRGLLGLSSNDLLALGSGLLSGRNWGEGASAAFGNVSKSRRQAEEDELTRQAMDLRKQQMAQGGALDELRAEKMRAEIEQLNNPLANVKRGLQPVPIIGPDGKPAIGQLGTDGRLVPSELPEGYSVSQKPIKVDAGNKFILLDPITRQPVGEVSKNLADAAAETARGKVSGEAQAQIPMLEKALNETMQMIDEVSAHPGLDMAVGPMQGTPLVQGITSKFSGDVADFRERVEQLQGSAFLQAFESLKGGGQITEIEGQKATQAKARLSTAKSEPAFRAALNDYKRVLRDVFSAVKMRGGATVQNPYRGDAGASVEQSTSAELSIDDLINQYDYGE